MCSRCISRHFPDLLLDRYSTIAEYETERGHEYIASGLILYEFIEDEFGIQLDTEENPKTVGEFADTVEAALEK